VFSGNSGAGRFSGNFGGGVWQTVGPKIFRCKFFRKLRRVKSGGVIVSERKLELVKVEFDKAETASPLGRRYVPDSYAAKNLREAGRRASMKLLQMVENESIWESLPDRVKVQVITMALDRAYGRVETLTSDLKVAEPEDGGGVPAHLRALAGSLALPELKNVAKAEK
jgi:hypothetical protein